MWWDIGKIKIKEITIEVSKIISREEREIENSLNKQIDLIHSKNPNDPLLDELKEAQKMFYENKAKGAKIRARAKWEEDGEKPTRFFHSLEEKHSSDRTWTKIKDTDGQEYSNIKDIQRIQVKFYQQLYTAPE